MDNLTIVFNKIKNTKNEYLIILENYHIGECIIRYFTLNKIKDMKIILELLSLLIRQYKIKGFDIIIEDKQIEMNEQLLSIVKYSPF